MKRKTIFSFIILCLILFIFSNKTEAKYILSKSLNVAKINMNAETIDTESPKIFGYENEKIKIISDEEFWSNDNVSINYSDNIAVKSAVYYYNSNEKEFNEQPTDFESNIEFSNEGWYKVVVTDYYENVSIKYFLIDKTAPTIDNINNTGYKEKITIGNISDNLSGIKSAILLSNPEENNFEGVEAKEVKQNDILEDLGFYRIVLTDNVGNINNIDFNINNGLINIDVIGNNSYNSSSENTDTTFKGWCNIDSQIVVRSNSKIVKCSYFFNPNVQTFEEENDFDLSTNVTKEGFYLVKAIDVFGNEANLVFGIDKTPPIIEGVENDEIYIVE